MELHAHLSVIDNMKTAFAEKVKVEVYLRGGKSLSGLIHGIGDHTLVLVDLTGREMFGACIRLDEIVGYEVRLKKAESVPVTRSLPPLPPHTHA